MATTWGNAARRGLASGSLASVASAAMLVLCAALENRRPLSPLNGPSQWIWGERTARRSDATLRHTAVGYAIHHASAVMWATLHEKAFDPARRRPSTAELSRAAATTAIAAFVDYALTPRRLEPGFEKHLSLPSIVATYAAFALGLAAARARRQHGTHRKDR
jgi:hypothetical protein